MTCIAGIIHKGKVYIGGDSAGNNGGSMMGVAAGKVFRNGDFVIGGCGTLRLIHLARYSFSPPAIAEDGDLDEYMATTFVNELRECLSNGGFISIEEKKEFLDGMLLVGFRGRIYVIDGEFAAFRPIDPYAAIGSGGDIAMGVLYATQKMQPKERINIALKAAEHLDDNVRAPFHIETV